MQSLIQGAITVLPDQTTQADVLIENSTIKAIFTDPADRPSADQVDQIIHADGMYLIPGVIDAHVHFREPGVTHKEDLDTATQACAKGGVTSFHEMPNTIPQTTTIELLHEKLEIASKKSHVNYGFYLGATNDNLEELKQVQRSPGIKIFIGSSTGNMLVDDQEILEKIFAETTLPICAHCEDETIVNANSARLDGGKTHMDHSRIRDHKAAYVCTQRAIDLAVRHQHHFHLLHVSTAAELELLTPEVREYVTSEVCPHHLYFNVDDYERLGSLVQMNPSVKFPDDNAGLFQGLLDGVLDMIATDHAPHTTEEKDQPYPKSPSGLPAVENSLHLMLNEVNQSRFTLEQVVQWMCSKPAEIWNMKNKGKIQVGYDADLTLIDMNAQHTIRNEEQLTKCGWSPWHGTKLQGQVKQTICMGQTVFENGKVNLDVLGTEIQYER